MFRNERVWYRRTSAATGKPVLSNFSPDTPHVVYEQEYWKSDAWDPLAYGSAYDPARSFWEQLRELFERIPHPNLIQKNTIGSEYSNYALNLKNCYFAVGTDTAEDCMYTFTGVLRARRSLDVHLSTDTEFSYELVDCEKSNRLRFAQECEGCINSYFLYDCRNCSDCFGCVGLRNKQYHIWNEPYSKEEYEKKLSELKPTTYRGIAEAKRRFEGLKRSVPRKYATIFKSENVAGDDIMNSRNCHDCFNLRQGVENCRHCYRIWSSKEGMDTFIAWNGAELFYESVSVSSQRTLCSAYIWGGFDVRYSYNCFDCNNIFGCVGLHNKSYCVLNRQCSKEEYEELVPKIIAQMNAIPYVDRLGRTYGYGDFFPPEFSPHVYNETVAQEYFPLSKEDAERQGFGWRAAIKKEYEVTMRADEVPDDIALAEDQDLLAAVVGCAHGGSCKDQCATAFRILPAELQFYRQMGVPLPRLCPNCRHGERVRLKNPLRLWSGKCRCAGPASADGAYRNTTAHFHGAAPCPNEFETPYAPERPEIVYCEQCYNAEVA